MMIGVEIKNWLLCVLIEFGALSLCLLPACAITESTSGDTAHSFRYLPESEQNSESVSIVYDATHEITGEPNVNPRTTTSTPITGWDYSDQAKWAGEFPQCQGIKLRQSPIDILTEKVTFGPNMRLDFVDYDQDVEFELKNTHHSVSLTPVTSAWKPSVHVNFANVDAHYDLQEIHFHWGDGLDKGSEHEINDRRFAAEMHMVHYRRGIEKSQIGNVENSVAVVGIFIESDSVEHDKLEPIIQKIARVNGTDSCYKDESPVKLSKLLPDEHHGFFAYNGSLTTPPCYEVVTWILMSEPVYMSQDRLVELSNFETLCPEKGRQKISRNYRNVQPLLNRPVYASFNTTDTNIHVNPSRQQQQHQNKTTNEDTFARRHLNLFNSSFMRAVHSMSATQQNLWNKLKGILSLTSTSRHPIKDGPISLKR